MEALIAFPFYLLAVLFAQQHTTLINNHCFLIGLVDILEITFLSTVIIVHFLILLYFFSEQRIVIVHL